MAFLPGQVDFVIPEFVLVHLLALLQHLQNVQGIQQVLLGKRLLVLVGSYQFRDVVDVVAG